MTLIEELKEKISSKNASIIFPEGEDERILMAASRLASEKVLIPILLGEEEKIKKIAEEKNLDIKNFIILNHKDYDDIDSLVEHYVDRRNGKDTREDAYQILENPNYFGAMLVYMDRVDGMVSGAVHTTADTVRPALQIIKTKPGIRRTSGLFLISGKEKYLMADCAINIDLTAEDLAEIALNTYESGIMFGFSPRIAMLSFSTKGSASSEEVDKVAEATRIAKKRNPDIVIDGELQFDAAISSKVGEKKAPKSEVAGRANAFIFPNLAAGNIGYKIAQYLGGYEAIGPILQGLNKPVNDLSRGCNEDDVYALAIITAAQAVL